MAIAQHLVLLAFDYKITKSRYFYVCINKHESKVP